MKQERKNKKISDALKSMFLFSNGVLGMNLVIMIVFFNRNCISGI